MDYLKNYEFWCQADLPEDVRIELAELRTNIDELKGRFGTIRYCWYAWHYGCRQ